MARMVAAAVQPMEAWKAGSVADDQRKNSAHEYVTHPEQATVNVGEMENYHDRVIQRRHTAPAVFAGG